MLLGDRAIEIDHGRGRHDAQPVALRARRRLPVWSLAEQALLRRQPLGRRIYRRVNLSVRSGSHWKPSRGTAG